MCIVEREEFSLGNKLSRKSNQVRLMTIIINKKTTITTKNAIGTLVNTDIRPLDRLVLLVEIPISGLTGRRFYMAFRINDDIAEKSCQEPGESVRRSGKGPSL